MKDQQTRLINTTFILVGAPTNGGPWPWFPGPTKSSPVRKVERAGDMNRKKGKSASGRHAYYRRPDFLVLEDSLAHAVSFFPFILPEI